MKKFYIPYIVFSLILITQFIINTNYQNISEKKQVDVQKLNTTVLPEKKTDFVPVESISHDYFMIKAENDKIYLFDSNKNKIEILDIDYNSLRNYDKKLFSDGIKVKNIYEVHSLIEDFSN